MQLKLVPEAEVLLERSRPLVQSVVFLAVAAFEQDLLLLVSSSLDHSDAATSNPYHANIPLVMRNGHAVLGVSSVRQLQ